MALANIMKEKLVAGELVVGMSDHTGSPAIVEIMAKVGFDYVWIDTEHTPFGMEKVEELVRASDAGGATPVVRVYMNDPYLIMRTLDTGAQGIIVPNVRSAEDARRAVQATRFPPEGKRGMCPGVRAAGYLLSNWNAYWPKANQEIFVAVIVENREGVKNLDEILSVPGVDAVVPGPGDYSQEVGLPISHPEVVSVMHDVIRRTLKAGKQIISILLEDLTSTASYLSFKQMKREYDMGVRGFLYTNDVLVWAQLCKDLAGAKNALIGARP
jgi:4-hydroxy-2-oxoheptanedioate aldolase